MSTEKMSLLEVSHLIADKISMKEIAKLSGWSEESIRLVIQNNLYEKEIDLDNDPDTEWIDYSVDDYWFDDEREYAHYYEREEGDPQELNFHDE